MILVGPAVMVTVIDDSLSHCLGIYGERSKQAESLTQKTAKHKKVSCLGAGEAPPGMAGPLPGRLRTRLIRARLLPVEPVSGTPN
ncbi:hypothetical protein GCM10009712_19900 [Pseudarthrobacter sulfonivorans]